MIGILYVISHGWGGGNGNDFGKDRLFLERKPIRLAHRSPAIYLILHGGGTLKWFLA